MPLGLQSDNSSNMCNHTFNYAYSAPYQYITSILWHFDILENTVFFLEIESATLFQYGFLTTLALFQFSIS